MQPNMHVMSDELWYLRDALAMRERLRVLADLQASYWEALVERGFDPSVATQFTAEWSNLAYGMTFQGNHGPASFDDLEGLLGRALDAPSDGAQPPPPAGDPSNVPPGEPWLVLAPEPDEVDTDDGDARNAA